MWGHNTKYHGIFQHNIKQLFCHPYPQFRNPAINANAVKIQIKMVFTIFTSSFLSTICPLLVLNAVEPGRRTFSFPGFKYLWIYFFQNFFFSFKFKKPGRSHSSFPGFSDFALRSTMWVFSEIFEVKVFFRSIWHFVTWGPGMNWSRRTGALYTQLHPMFTVMFLVEMFVHSSWLLSIMDQMWSICQVALGDTFWKFIFSLNRA